MGTTEMAPTKQLLGQKLQPPYITLNISQERKVIGEIIHIQNNTTPSAKQRLKKKNEYGVAKKEASAVTKRYMLKRAYPYGTY